MDCSCLSPLGDPNCPRHGYLTTAGERQPGEKFASELMGRAVSDLGDCRRLKFLVMDLIAQTMHRVPSTMLGWTPDRLKEITDLCK